MISHTGVFCCRGDRLPLPASVFLIGLLAFDFALPAQDSVHMIRAPDGKAFEIEGEIVAFDRDTLTIRTVQQRSRVLPYASVTSVEFALIDSHQSGVERLGQGKWEIAIKSLGTALQRERRDWVRQRILRDLSLAYRFRGDFSRSAATALVLYRDFPRTNQQDALPLNWIPGEQEGARLVNRWLESNRAAEQLLGASWSLSGPARRHAVEVLRHLSESSDRWIAQLATAQLWRTELATATKSKCERWTRLVDGMSPALRAGPLYVLGLAWAEVGDEDLAAMTLMQIPVLHPDAQRLSVEALMRTARFVGDDERVAVYREVVDRYAFMPQAELAKNQLVQLQKKASDG